MPKYPADVHYHPSDEVDEPVFSVFLDVEDEFGVSLTLLFSPDMRKEAGGTVIQEHHAELLSEHRFAPEGRTGPLVEGDRFRIHVVNDMIKKRYPIELDVDCVASSFGGKAAQPQESLIASLWEIKANFDISGVEWTGHPPPPRISASSKIVLEVKAKRICRDL
ncbi:hypothetical protein N9N28_15465 [Rubripirellula amarantea]|nr:hypothetical protein [Rubripirellula amarantea]